MSQVAGPPLGRLVWLDGEVVDAERARISPFDHGFTVGDGVFETMKVLGATPFALTRHLARLRRSAELLGLPIPPDVDLRAAISALVDATGADEGRLRVTVTGGEGPPGSGRGDGRPTVLVVMTELAPPVPAASVITVPWRRNEHGPLVGAKCTSYAENVVALAEARRRGGDEALFANTAGNLCEGTGTNVFVGIGGRLVTPPLSAGPLAGVTRELVLEVTDAVEDDLPLSALADADEVLLTSTTREVQPVAQVDGRPVASAPGPLTSEAAARFAELVRGSLDP